MDNLVVIFPHKVYLHQNCEIRKLFVKFLKGRSASNLPEKLRLHFLKNYFYKILNTAYNNRQVLSDLAR